MRTMPSTRGADTTRRCLPPPQTAHEKRATGILTYMKLMAEIMLAPLASCSDALLQGSSRESLNDLPRGPCLRHHYLAEDLLLASLRGRLRPGLQPAQAREGEDACLADLLRRDLRQAVNDLRAHRLLELARRGKCLGNRTLSHRLACRLHRLHGGHFPPS